MYLIGTAILGQIGQVGHPFGDEVLRRVQRDLDLETMLLESGEDDAPESPYDTL